MVTAIWTFGPPSQWSAPKPLKSGSGTAPNGHFDASLKSAGHGQGTKWAQDGHNAKRRPCGPASDNSKLLFLFENFGCGGRI